MEEPTPLGSREEKWIMRGAGFAFVAFAGLLTACGHECGLGLHNQVTVKSNSVNETVPCCGGSWTKDVPLPSAGDGEFDISNVAQFPEPVDAFLIPTSCSALFNGPYPGAAPLCQVYLGPVAPKTVSGRVKLDAGTYRLWLQAHDTNQAPSQFFVDIGIYDYRCVAPINVLAPSVTESAPLGSRRAVPSR